MQEADAYSRITEKMRDIPKSRFAIKILRKLVTPEDAEILAELPAPPEELAMKFNLAEEVVNRKLEEFLEKGLVVVISKEGKKRYFTPNTVFPQFHDNNILAILKKKELEPVDTEVLDLWQGFKETELYEDLKDWEARGVGHWVTPVRGAIKDKSGMLPLENLEAIVRNAEVIALNQCTCRAYRVMTKKCDKPCEVHMQLTARDAEYTVAQGTARRIDVKEALEILDLCEEAGLVPGLLIWGDRARHICQQCVDCSINLRPLVCYGFQLEKPSRYQATVNLELCNSCGDCVDRCAFSAIQMRVEPTSKTLKAYVDPEKCHGSGLCVVKCPTGALTLKVVRPPEHLPPIAPSPTPY